MPSDVWDPDRAMMNFKCKEQKITFFSGLFQELGHTLILIPPVSC